MKISFAAKLCLLLPLVGMLGCPSPAPDSTGGTATPTPSPKQQPDNTATVPQATNHIEGFDRELLQFTDQGSGFFPMSIVAALNDWKTGHPFLENLERFGLVPGERSDLHNKNGFPVGIVTNTINLGGRDVEMFGFNCAACHTSDFRYKGETIRVDGGSGLFYVDELGDRLGRSLKVTLENPEEFLAFLLRYLKDAKTEEAQFASLKKIADEGRNSALGKALRTELGKRGKELLEDLRKIKGAENNSGKDAQPRPSLVDIFKSNSDVEKLQKDISEKFENDPLIKMAADIAKVIAELRDRLDFLQTRDWLSSDPVRRVAAGYGRADDFGTARVELFGKWSPKNRVPVDAPVSVPPLWNVDKYAWLHWNQNTNSVIQRSIGEALGVGAWVDPTTGKTSVAVVNQMKIEEQVQKLTAPAWPDRLFGTPDPEKVEKGRKLFKEFCVGCHGTEKITKNGLVEFNLYTLKEAGTDPKDAQNFDRPVFQADESTVGFADSIASLLNLVQNKAKEAMSKTEKELLERLETNHSPAEWRDTLKKTGGPVYPARPLEGIWATAPYLHNGSVPTLYHLLFPDERPPKFPVGQKDYDPVKVGFEIVRSKITTQPDLELFEFDTSVTGNANTGHAGKDYGTELSRDDRMALIEYLKVHHDQWPAKAVETAPLK